MQTTDSQFPHASDGCSPPICCETAVLSLERHAHPGTAHTELFTLRLDSPGWRAWYPGQFVMLRPHSTPRPDIFWARPFSISRADDKEVCIVFQVAGRATTALRQLQRGAQVTIWGPLGNSFALSRSGPTLLLAGGIGIAPFVGYIERHPAPETLRLEFGHRLPLDCYPFAACLGTDPVKGTIVAHNHRETCPEDLARFSNLMADTIRDTAAHNGLVLACGPMPFLKCVQRLSLQHTAKTQLSLETRMACGVGACLGCVVKKNIATDTHRPDTPEAFCFVQTCTSGPVFWADELLLED